MNKALITFAIALILSFLTLGSKAEAYGRYSGSSIGGEDSGWIIMPSGIYYFYTLNQNNNAVTTTRMVGDITAGYHWGLFYLGGDYNFDQQSTTGNGPTSTNTFKSYGAEIGLMTDSAFLTFSYFFGSAGTVNGGTANAVDYTNGTGYQVGLGYLFDLGSGWHFGPEFIYRTTTYTSLASGQSANPNFVFATFLPELAIKYSF